MAPEKTKELQTLCQGVSVFGQDIIQYLKHEKLFNLWVPRKYNGREASLKNGLNRLYELAKTDGTLGWTVTLCAGANYFIGNMTENARNDIFRDKYPVLGGSGMLGGTAEKKGNNYILNGTWKYATGAVYLTHFTLNAVITENGKTKMTADGKPEFLSFVLPRSAVNIIHDWNMMGMKASATESFSVTEYKCNEEYAFQYNRSYLPDLIFKVPFPVFADLTLLVNYMGMYDHFREECRYIEKGLDLSGMEQLTQNIHARLDNYIAEMETLLEKGNEIPAGLAENLYQLGSFAVQEMAATIIHVWPYLGTKAAKETEQLNTIFRDFFTATQHHNFIRKQEGKYKA